MYHDSALESSSTPPIMRSTSRTEGILEEDEEVEERLGGSTTVGAGTEVEGGRGALRARRLGADIFGWVGEVVGREVWSDRGEKGEGGQ